MCVSNFKDTGHFCKRTKVLIKAQQTGIWTGQ